MSFPVLFLEPRLTGEIASLRPQDRALLQGTGFTINWCNCCCSGHNTTDLCGCLWEPYIRLCRISEWGKKKKKDFGEKEIDDPFGIPTLDTKGLNVACISIAETLTWTKKKKKRGRQRTKNTSQLWASKRCQWKAFNNTFQKLNTFYQLELDHL